MTWHLEPPVLTGKYCVVREVLPADASALVRTVTNEAVVRFIPAPPQSARAFDKFIELAIELRTNGKGLSLVVVPLSRGVASGLVTLRGPENVLGAVSETRPDSLAPDGRRADHLRWVLMFAP